jgi:hypothetical protein
MTPGKFNHKDTKKKRFNAMAQRSSPPCDRASGQKKENDSTQSHKDAKHTKKNDSTQSSRETEY